MISDGVDGVMDHQAACPVGAFDELTNAGHAQHTELGATSRVLPMRTGRARGPTRTARVREAGGLAPLAAAVR